MNRPLSEEDLSSPALVVAFGGTGTGKSFICNRLTQEGRFTESNQLESETSTISSAVGWNERDLVCDVPGYLDSKGRDQVQQANFVDFLSNKTVLTILFIFNNRVDAFVQSALNAFRESDLKNNVILVCNKDLAERPSDFDTYEGFPLVYVKAHQKDLSVLKRLIESKNAVKVKHLPVPACLFKTPLKVICTEMTEEFAGTEVVPEKETLVTRKTIVVQEPRRVWKGDFGHIFGQKKTIWVNVSKEVDDRTDVVVDRTYNASHVFRLTFAERFDGATSLYKKEFVEARKVRL